MAEFGGKNLVRVPLHENPLKPQEVTGYTWQPPISIKDDGQEMPDTLPDGTRLLTREEKMERDFDEAGQPLKGAIDD